MLQDIALMTTAEAAERLSVSTSWLKKQVATGQVAHTRLGRSVRFSGADLAEISTDAERGERRSNVPPGISVRRRRP
jgi:excisionase family DNA binding protein